MHAFLLALFLPVAFAQTTPPPVAELSPAWFTTGDVLQVQAEPGKTQTVRVRISEDDTHDAAAGSDITLLVPQGGVSGVTLEPGDRVVLRLQERAGGELQGTVVDRTHGGIWIVLICTLLVALFVGRRQGIGAIAPAAFSLLTILFLFLPLVLRGVAPGWAALVTVLVVASVLALVSFGWNRAAASAATGASIALVVTALIGWAYTALAALDSLTSPALDILRGLPGLELATLPLATSVLAAVGAIVHIVNRITGRIFLERRQHPDRELIALLDAGITQGRTLYSSIVEAALWVLFGVSLPVLILTAAQVSVFRIFLYGDPVRLLVVFATIVTGVALAVPIATITAALFASNER